jgi:hypothetical protein
MRAAALMMSIEAGAFEWPSLLLVQVQASHGRRSARVSVRARGWRRRRMSGELLV